jgi:hypothetical protein
VRLLFSVILLISLTCTSILSLKQTKLLKLRFSAKPLLTLRYISCWSTALSQRLDLRAKKEDYVSLTAIELYVVPPRSVQVSHQSLKYVVSNAVRSAQYWIGVLKSQCARHWCRSCPSPMFDVPDMNTEILECITVNTSACPPCKPFKDCMEHLAVIS